MPPNEVGPRAGHHSRHEGTDTIYTTPATTTATRSVDCSGAPRQCHGDTVPGQLQRRRLASYKCERLASGHRDPWQPWRPETLSEKQIDGYRDAVGHLRDAGLTPAALLPELRLLWRRGGDDRVLAVEVAQDWGLAG